MNEIIKDDYKTIINIRKNIDGWFWDKYSVSPYSGCFHDCVYCDCRASKYHLNEHFGENLFIKKDLHLALDNRIRIARKLLPDVTAVGGPSDPYLPMEKKYRSTRKCLEVLLKHKWPVFMATKGVMITEDADLLDSIAEKSWCSVGFTITGTKEADARFLEPKAPSPDKRFKALSKLKASTKNLKAGVLFIPIPIGFSDDPDTLRNMVVKCKDSGADFILFGGGITLTDRQGLYFLNKLNQAFPEKIALYEKTYGFKYNPESYKGSYGSVDGSMTKVHQRLFELCDKHGLDYRMKRFIPEDHRKYNYMVAEILFRDAYKNMMLEKDWYWQNWAAVNIQNLKESIIRIWKAGKLHEIRSVNSTIVNSIEKILTQYTSSDDWCPPGGQLLLFD